MDKVFAQTAQTAASTTAQTAPKAAPASPFGSNLPILPMLLIVGLFYYLMIHLPKKEQQKKDDTLKAIQRGDRVLTRGGLYGIVADIKEHILILKINETHKVEIHRDYVESVQKPS